MADLSIGDWQSQISCPRWSVHAVACDILGIEIGHVSLRRDGWI